MYRVRTAALAVCLTHALFPPSAIAQPTVGLFVHEDEAQPGYTFFGPSIDESVYLIDNGGRLIRKWTTQYEAGMMGYLRPNGNLVRAAHTGSAGFGGVGGTIQEFTWTGNRIWEFDADTPEFLQHHDLELLPDGHVLITVWEFKTGAEATQAGRTAPGPVWPDAILELAPAPPLGADVVWEWHSWDHLIQDADPTRSNFGIVADHPELIDVNFGATSTDWTHVNAVAYNAELDQIILSVLNFNEVWVIDHSTTTAEAAGHTGGNSGKGGDLLYRWGNPRAYRRGTVDDQKLYGQHDSHWIPGGYPGEGNLLVYNNGSGRPAGPYSTVEELTPPVDENGIYDIDPRAAYGPSAPVWSYTADPPADFYSSFISGAQRQPNGNTLICEGAWGRLFEVTPGGDIVWEYVNPIGMNGPLMQGDSPGPHFVFKVRRYPEGHPAFDGRDLTPGDPVELFNSPEPVPSDSLAATRLSGSGDTITLSWDAASCPSFDYNLLYGDLDSVATHDLIGAECSIGPGTYTWTGGPTGSLYFLVVGTDDTAVYESSWGASTAGERNGSMASFECGATTKVVTATCP